MMRTVLAWITALVLLGLTSGLVEAGARWPHCRPYTVENTCPPGHRLCHLKMVYAPSQTPGADAHGYWYGTPHPAVLRHGHHHHHAHMVKHHRHHAKHHARHHRHHAKACGYRCWYKHPPRHGLPFGD